MWTSSRSTQSIYSFNLTDPDFVNSLQEGEQLVKKIGGVFAFKVKDGPEGKEGTWVVDVKNGKGSVTTDPGVYVGGGVVKIKYVLVLTCGLKSAFVNEHEFVP